MYKYLGSSNILLYDLLGTISGVLLFVFNLSQIKRKKLFMSDGSNLAINYFSKKRNLKFLSNVTLWAFMEMLLISCIQYLPGYNWFFGGLVGTGANYYGLAYISPVALMLFFYLISVDPLKQMDLITPAYPLALTVSKIACFCHGCCNGIRCSFGLYNHGSGLVEFPVQLVEAGLALLIFIFLLLWKKKAKDGTLFPTYLIAYSATRFFSEFLRSEPDVIWKLKTYHILCISGVIVGIIELVIVLKFGDKIRGFFTPNFVVKMIEKKNEEKKKQKQENMPKRKR